MQYDKADQQNCPRRVVFYGRVSTELEAQISALKNQMNWYLELAEHHPNWTVVGQYADEGISGTGMKTRPSFMKIEKVPSSVFCALIPIRLKMLLARCSLMQLLVYDKFVGFRSPDGGNFSI